MNITSDKRHWSFHRDVTRQSAFSLAAWHGNLHDGLICHGQPGAPTVYLYESKMASLSTDSFTLQLVIKPLQCVESIFQLFTLVHTFFLFFRHYVNTLIYRLNLFLFCLPVSAEHSWRHRRSWNSVLCTWPNSCTLQRYAPGLGVGREMRNMNIFFKKFADLVFYISSCCVTFISSWLLSNQKLGKFFLFACISCIWCVVIERSLLMKLCLHHKNVTRQTSDHFYTVFIGFLYNNWSLRIL